jgi:DNA-binding SARP family transcriptional activator
MAPGPLDAMARNALTLHMRAERHTGSSAPLVHLFGRPCVSQDGRRWDIGEGSNRLLAFLALRRGHVERRHIAGSLWPGVADSRASGNLRSALWRLNRQAVRLVRAEHSSLRLHEDVRVDVHLLADWAARVVSNSREPEDLAIMPWDVDRLELLPGWYDDWVLIERERLRQRLLHAMEALSREMTRQGRHAEAVDASIAVVSAEPLRESGQRVLIEALLAEGNWSEARGRLASYGSLLARELGVEPPPSLVALLLQRRAASAGKRVEPVPENAAGSGRVGRPAEQPVASALAPHLDELDRQRRAARVADLHANNGDPIAYDG